MNDIILSSNIDLNGIEFELRKTGANGFNIDLLNGYSVSVQWGVGNYADNYNYIFNSFVTTDISLRSKTAEVAVFNPKGKLIETPFNPGDTVMGWQTIEDIKKIIIWANSIGE